MSLHLISRRDIEYETWFCARSYQPWVLEKVWGGIAILHERWVHFFRDEHRSKNVQKISTLVLKNAIN